MPATKACSLPRGSPLAGVFLIAFTLTARAQVDSENGYHLSGSASVTSKGISTIPSFTLGKPAAIFDAEVGKGRLSFEPLLRFSLEGKPWTFIFWWRYQLATAGKFRLRIGAHPALSFRTTPLIRDEVAEDVIEVRRFLAGETSASYLLSGQVSVGVYYLYSHGFEKSAPGNTNYVGLNASLTNTATSPVALRLTPQVYYLRVDEHDGFYFTSTLAVSKRNSPITVTGFVNKIIRTDVPGSDDFLWSLSLIYSFYLRQNAR